MKSRLLLMAGVLACSFWVGCNCGHAVGVDPCSTSSDCPPSQTCTEGVCSPEDGGSSTGTDDGGTQGQTDGGDGGPTDSGDGGPTDGGTLPPCVGLQCQQQPWITCPASTTTTLTGKVYDPSASVALYNAVVYVPNSALQPFTEGVRCETCGAQTSGSPIALTVTGPDGAFQLQNVPAGQNIPLVIQIGHWRRTITLPSVTACETTPLPDTSIRMPRNQSEGELPLMAIATGNADPFECLLRKMGISDTEFTVPTKGGRVHYYVSNGAPLAGDTAPALGTLVNDLDTLKKYDMVLLPCEGGETLKSATQTQNIIDYTSLGGRLLATHYGYVWIAKAQEPFASTAAWQPDRQQIRNPPNPATVTLNTTFPKGQAFAQWLYNVGASTTPGSLSLTDLRNDVTAASPPVSMGWMSVTYTGSNTRYTATPYITFNTPVSSQTDGGAGPQCGRVTFSDFHMSSTSVVVGQTEFPTRCKVEPLSAQERALVFMLFDLSSCLQKDDTAPQACAPTGGSCTADADCCGGLSCQDSSAQPCNGGSCACGIPRP